MLGRTSIDQAPVTGESVPVDKEAAPDRAVDIAVTRLIADTTLAKVVKIVSAAETQKLPTQRFTDRFERIFVPSVIALAIATPNAVLSGGARAARIGLLMKGGATRKSWIADGALLRQNRNADRRQTAHH